MGDVFKYRVGKNTSKGPGSMRQTAPIGERNSSISTTIVGGGKLSVQKITARRDKPAGPRRGPESFYQSRPQYLAFRKGLNTILSPYSRPWSLQGPIVTLCPG